MGIGSLIFGSVGSFIRWSIKGFKTKYSDEFYGTMHEDITDKASHRLVNNVVGLVVIVVVCYLIVKNSL